MTLPILAADVPAGHDYFGPNPVDKGLVGNPHVWGTFLGLGLAIILLALLAYGIARLRNPFHRYIKAHNTNIRYFTYTSGKGSIYVFDKSDLSKSRVISVDRFLKDFDTTEDHAKSRELKAWLDNHLAGKPGTPMFFSAKTKISSNKKQLMEVLLKVSSVNTEEGILHFESHMLANVSLASATNGFRKHGQILSYLDYLRNFRSYIIKKRPAGFFFLGLQADQNSSLYQANGLDQGATVQFLCDFLAKKLLPNQYLIPIHDSAALFFIDLRRLDYSGYKKEGYDLKEEMASFLSVNSIDDRYNPIVGCVIHNENDSVYPLKQYVIKAQAMAEEAYSSPDAHQIRVFESQENLFIATSNDELMDAMVSKGMFRIYYLPFFNLESGSPEAYLLELFPYGTDKFQDSLTFMEEAKRTGLLTALRDKAMVRVNARGTITERAKTVIIPMKISMADSFASGSVAPSPNLSIRFAFFESEVEKYSGPKLERMIKNVKAAGLGPLLIVGITPPSVSSEMMSLFAGFLVQPKDGRSGAKDPVSRVKTLSTLHYLSYYGKPVYMESINNEIECYFAKIHNISAVSSPKLCLMSSAMERLDLEGGAIIEDINAKPTLGRY